VQNASKTEVQETRGASAGGMRLHPEAPARIGVTVSTNLALGVPLFNLQRRLALCEAFNASSRSVWVEGSRLPI
jgi:hypothetical protein